MLQSYKDISVTVLSTKAPFVNASYLPKQEQPDYHYFFSVLGFSCKSDEELHFPQLSFLEQFRALLEVHRKTMLKQPWTGEQLITRHPTSLPLLYLQYLRCIFTYIRI